MRTLHFDCFSGISGDMTVAALVDAGADRDAVLAAVGSLGLPVEVQFQPAKRAGIAGTYFAVRAEPEHKHRHLHHIEAIVNGATLTDEQRGLALRIFGRLADAEAAVHGIPVAKVHFHEVGAADSIVDIVAAAVAFTTLGVASVTSRSVPTGTGTVNCDHGVMPVPAPATAQMLRGAPLAPSNIEAELTTPTGAAILTTLVQSWTDAPTMTIDTIGVGAGTKEIPRHANVLRVFVGNTTSPDETDTVWVLETNLDDVPGEVIGYCTERLFAAGALDAYTIPIQMKKGRPGVLLGAIAPPDRVAELEAVIFRETGTLGIRKHEARRAKQQREAVTVETAWGPVRAKRTWRTGGTESLSPEYEDCAAIARQHNLPIRAVMDAAQDAPTKRR